MPIQIYIERLRYLDSLIQTKATGTVQQLAKKMGISEISVLKYIKAMKEMGCPIKYCRRRSCYYYTEDGKALISFFDKHYRDLKNSGGVKLFYKLF